MPKSAVPAKIFCERLPRIARVYARQTECAAAIVRLIGYVAAGRPGQRILERLSMRTSDDTVLRRIQEESVHQDCLPVRNLGVDDWAWRKGQEYKEPCGLEDLNAQMKEWVWTVANERIHGTTHEKPVARWTSERGALQPVGNRPPYPITEDEPRRVARDAYVAWQGSRYFLI